MFIMTGADIKMSKRYQQNILTSKFNSIFNQLFQRRKSRRPKVKIEKKNPLISIKKSILPILGKSAELGHERSMLSQIL